MDLHLSLSSKKNIIFLIKMNTDQIKNLVREIQNLFFRRDYKTIISTSKNAIKKYPNIAIFYNLLGLALSNIGNLKDAKFVLEKGYKINSNDLAIINNLANVYKNSYEITKAIELYERSIKIDNNYVNAYVNYGNLKRDLNKFNEAIKLYEKALSINPNIPSINYCLSMSYQNLGNFEKSDHFAKKTLEIEPKFTKADLLISRSKKYKNNDQHKEDMIRKLDDLDLDNNSKSDLYFAISKAFEDQTDMENSIKYLKKANEIKRSIINFNIDDEIKNFESIKKTYLDIIDKKNTLKINNPKKIIFILGMPRSGTTLIEQIISSHSKVYSSGELPYLSLILKNNFFENKKIIENKAISTLGDVEICKKLSEQYFAFINNYGISQDYVTDKAPLNFLWIGFIKILFPDSKIIHSMRDSKDNCISLYKNTFDGSLDFCYTEKELGNYYNLYKDLMNFWSEKIPNQFLDVKYENLINNSEHEIKKIIDYCGLNWEDNCLNFANSKNPIKTVSVGQARMPIYKTSLKSSQKFKPYLKELFKII